MKIRIYLKSFDEKLLQSTSNEFLNTLEVSDCIYTPFINLPKRKKKFCVLCSPHIDKDSREQFELTIYKRFIDITPKSASFLDNLLRIEIDCGVQCSLTLLKH